MKLFELVSSMRHPSDTLGIERGEMPQIEKDDYPELIKYMKSHDVNWKKNTISTRELKPIQKDFTLDRMMKAVRKAKIVKPLLATSDNYIIDGHHRWLATMSIDSTDTMDVIQFDAPANVVMELINKFPKTTYKEIY